MLNFKNKNMENKFNAKVAKDKIIADLKLWFESVGMKNAVIGISGGKDSTIVAGLLCEALGKDHVYGITMPNGIQKDINDSNEICEYFGIHKIESNIKLPYDGILASLTDYIKEPSNQTMWNLPPRLRMCTLYAFAQSLNAMVVGTSNLSEYMIGWCTKWGDMAADFEPIIEYTCTEVKQIGYELGIPTKWIDKAPSDGLVGISDEEKLGFKYSDLDRYIRTGLYDNENTMCKMDSMIRKSAFKRCPIASSKVYWQI